MRSVVVCGSKKYAQEIHQFCQNLHDQGVLVFEPNFSQPLHEDAKIGTPHTTRMIFKGLTLEHFDWIRKADVCFVYNQDEYVGVSVSMEMAYAAALGKPIFALNPNTGDPCRDALIDKTVQNEEELFRLLR